MTTILYIPKLFGFSIEVYFISAALGVPVFLIWSWLLKKVIASDKTRKIIIWAVTILTTPLIYLGLILFWVLWMSYYPAHDFDREKWFADKENRYEFSEDIIDNKMLIGKTKSEVRQLLGDEGNTDESNHWTYNLGFRPVILNIDPDVLDIEFKNGTVVRVAQHET